MTRTFILFSLSALLLIGACGGDDGGDPPPPPPPPPPADAAMDVNGDARGPDGSTEAGPPDAMLDAAPEPCERTRLLISTSDYSVGQLATLGIEDRARAVAEEDNEDQDSLPASLACEITVLERSLGRMRIQNPELPFETQHIIDLNRPTFEDVMCVDDRDCACPGEDPFCGRTGSCVEGRCPSAYAVNPIRALQAPNGGVYVIAQGLNAVIVANPAAAGLDPSIDDIDLSAFLRPGDMDAKIDASDAIIIGNRLYVAIGNYWFDSSFEVQFEGSQLVVIDLETNSILMEETVNLVGNNPWKGLVHVEEANELWVVAPGAHGALDGSIEAVDLTTGLSRTTLITEEAAGGELNGLAYVGPEHAYLLIGDALYRWNPATGVIADTARATSISRGMYHHGGAIYAWGDVGMRIFEAATEMEITPVEGPLIFGIRPTYAVVAAP